MEREFTIKITVPIIKDEKTKTGVKMPLRFNVQGTKNMIRRQIVGQTEDQANTNFLLDEYEKYVLAEAAGVEKMPLSE